MHSDSASRRLGTWSAPACSAAGRVLHTAFVFLFLFYRKSTGVNHEPRKHDTEKDTEQPQQTNCSRSLSLPILGTRRASKDMSMCAASAAYCARCRPRVHVYLIKLVEYVSVVRPPFYLYMPNRNIK